jgi:SAM-dependent methyltransferase
MPGYALLLHPSANRVYSQSAPRLSAHELRILSSAAMAGRVTDVEEISIAGVPYLGFVAPELHGGDFRLLGALSTQYALFRRGEGGALHPVPLDPPAHFPGDLLTIQRYSGKTNEQLTRLLCNLTTLATDRPGDLARGGLRVLDPLAGRGTTLNQALMYGFDAYGVEADKRDVDEYAKFLKTWLRNNRYKHTASVKPIRENKTTLGHRFAASIGPDKERYRAGEVITVELIRADTTAAATFFPAGFFDLAVTDLPYGVRHGSRADREALSRRPVELLDAALPGWRSLLRPGGALGMSFNTRLAARARVGELVAAHGFELADSEPYRGFAHRVDASVTRDLVVARRPS